MATLLSVNEAAERLRIWQLHLPEAHVVSAVSVRPEDPPKFILSCAGWDTCSKPTRGGWDHREQLRREAGQAVHDDP